jgi:hypothetical protein
MKSLRIMAAVSPCMSCNSITSRFRDWQALELARGAAYINDMTDITTLNDRARDVFKLLVDQYISSGEPIGSRTLSKASSLNLSPALIQIPKRLGGRQARHPWRCQRRWPLAPPGALTRK